MPKINLKSRYSLPILAVVPVYLILLAQLIFDWPGLRVSGLKAQGKYIDQQLIIHFAKCFEIYGINIYNNTGLPNNCGGYQYSTFLLQILNLFHITNVPITELGLTTLLITLIAITFPFTQIKNAKFSELGLIWLSLAAPGTWLLLERGNFDEVVLVLVLIAAATLGSRHRWLAVTFIGISALMKFYTLPLLFYAVSRVENRKLRLICFLTLGLLSVYLFIIILRVEVFPGGWQYTFGLSSVGLELNHFLGVATSNMITFPTNLLLFPGITLVSLTFIIIRKKYALEIRSQFKPTNPYFEELLVVLEIVFISCYLAGMNFDYRLIYVSLIIAALLQVFPQGGFRNFLVTTGLIAVWLSCFTPRNHPDLSFIMQLLGDISLTIFTGALLVQLYEAHLRKQIGKVKQYL